MSLQRRVSDEPCGRRTRAALRRSPARSRPRTDGPARSDDYVGFRPGSGRAVVIDDCIAAFDDGEWLQNRLTADVEAGAAHPLDLANPNRNKREADGGSPANRPAHRAR